MVNNASVASKRTDRFSPVTLWRAVEAGKNTHEFARILPAQKEYTVVRRRNGTRIHLQSSQVVQFCRQTLGIKLAELR
jgi:hypothetical protein